MGQLGVKYMILRKQHKDGRPCIPTYKMEPKALTISSNLLDILNETLEYGEYTNFNQYNTSYECLTLGVEHVIFRKLYKNNKDVDDCIKEFQLKATNYEDVIEWIFLLVD
ncbi:hypothetical protein C2G38_2226178 [Gigaspora rosea]|uniref:Uncharacterized protein n=1 Tax=Gigaspora rosea TaxID=44941 RepID=A0A397TYH8_9GLOM|nr:hypothetical protein C2G38_2226178 [Gigaspora rosea]